MTFIVVKQHEHREELEKLEIARDIHVLFQIYFEVISTMPIQGSFGTFFSPCYICVVFYVLFWTPVYTPKVVVLVVVLAWSLSYNTKINYPQRSLSVSCSYQNNDYVFLTVWLLRHYHVPMRYVIQAENIRCQEIQTSRYIFMPVQGNMSLDWLLIGTFGGFIFKKRQFCIFFFSKLVRGIDVILFLS